MPETPPPPPLNFWAFPFFTAPYVRQGRCLLQFLLRTLYQYWILYSPQNDPQIDPRMISTLKWSPFLFTHSPFLFLILGMEWYPKTMDRAKCTTLIKFSPIIFPCPHSLMTLIWDYNLNWIKRKYCLVYF